MIKVIINGVNGRLGHTLVQVADEHDDIEIVAGIDISAAKSNYPFPVYTNIDSCNVPADVLLDFSSPKATETVLAYCIKKDLAAVIATTGLGDTEKQYIYNASKHIPVFYTANMSLGVNLVKKLAKQAAAVLEDGFDIEIIEKHHNHKADSPSGTALALADAINDALKTKHDYVFGRHAKDNRRDHNEIGIHAIRGGTVVGEHEILFLGNDEVITITHQAHSKNVFAVGAFSAARLIANNKPGLYDMDDVLEQ